MTQHPFQEAGAPADFVGAEYLAVRGPHRGQALRILSHDHAADRYEVEAEGGARFAPTSGLSVRAEARAQVLVRDAWWAGVRAGLIYPSWAPPSAPGGVDEQPVLRAAFDSGVAFARASWPAKPTDETY